MKINLYLGLNDKKTKKQEISTLEAYKITERLVLNSFDGCSISEQNGVYTHENGEIVHEKSLNIAIFTDNDVNNLVKVDKLARELCITFNQESVIIEKTQVSSSFYKLD